MFDRENTVFLWLKMGVRQSFTRALGTRRFQRADMWKDVLIGTRQPRSSIYRV